MHYDWILGIVIIPTAIVTGIYHTTIFDFLSSTNPFAEWILLIILIIVTGIVGISSLFAYFLERKKIPILKFNIFTKTKDTEDSIYFANQ